MIGNISRSSHDHDRANRGERSSGTTDPTASATEAPTNEREGKARQPGYLKELSPEDQHKLDALKKRDQEVRRHEQAHMAAAGSHARGGPSYQFQIGPDGQRYAVAGEVDVDLSPGRTPEETIAKARMIRAAALAPADPSGADRAVAAQASKMEADARQQLSRNDSQKATRDPVSVPVSRVNAVYHGSLQCNCHQIQPGAMADLAV